MPDYMLDLTDQEVLPHAQSRLQAHLPLHAEGYVSGRRPQHSSQVRGWTTAPKPAYRFLLIALAFVLLNVWRISAGSLPKCRAVG